MAYDAGKGTLIGKVVDPGAGCHVTTGRVWTFSNCMLWSLVLSVTQSILVSCLLGVPYVVWYKLAWVWYATRKGSAAVRNGALSLIHI